jgi:glutaredoxin-like YruB-family protein
MTIKIYSTPSCPYCQLAKDFFREKNLEFSEVNVAEDEAALQEMIAKSGQMRVPIIEIDGQIITGFNRPELERMIGK